jgi:two-component system NtrC family sensor kinase
VSTDSNPTTQQIASSEPLATMAAPAFQALLEAAPDAIVIVDTNGRIVLANGQVERLFGYRSAELVGQLVDMLLPGVLRERHAQHRASYFAAPRTRPMGIGLELMAQRLDGSTFPVEISLSALPTEQGMLATSIIRDITDRKRATDELERQVQQRTAHLKALLEFSQELLGARDLEAVLQRVLDFALELTPQADCGAIYLYDSSDDQLALRASAGFHHLPSFRLPLSTGVPGLAFARRKTVATHAIAELVSVLPELAHTDRERLLILFDQPELPSGTLAIPLIVHDQGIGVLLLLRKTGAGAFAQEAHATLEGLANITAAAVQERLSTSEAATLSSQLSDLAAQQQTMAERLSTAEAAVLQAARLAAVGQLAASIAHEINNPLYAARNALYLIEEELPEELRSSLFLNLARDELARIAGIIERMRDFYRPTRGDMAAHDLNHLLEETLTIAGLNMRHTAIRVIFTPWIGLQPVMCNSDQLRQVFLNLVLNAIDAMPDGGTLKIRTAVQSGRAVIEIVDTGVGIPQSLRDRLFEPFFTSKPTGTGLGLSISAHIVTQHGGQIEVESSEGQGSTFRVVLPYQQAS